MASDHDLWANRGPSRRAGLPALAIQQERRPDPPPVLRPMDVDDVGAIAHGRPRREPPEGHALLGAQQRPAHADESGWRTRRLVEAGEAPPLQAPPVQT